MKAVRDRGTPRPDLNRAASSWRWLALIPVALTVTATISTARAQTARQDQRQHLADDLIKGVNRR